MRNLAGSPLVRISLGLVMLTCSILLMFEFLGLVPTPKTYELKYRKSLVESLAVQINSDIINNNLDNLTHTLTALVSRNDGVASAAVRQPATGIIAQFGPHEKQWSLKATDKSTASQIQIGIHKGGKQWGTIEVRFNDLQNELTPFYILILFVAMSGFVCYWLFLKRTMLELDPGSVVPERVRTALNTLSDGLLIVDANEQIIFSNQPFLQKSALSNESILGKKASELDWLFESEQVNHQALPWLAVIDGQPVENGADLKLKSKSGQAISFKVNVSAIGETGSEIRGALITFNDITELESKNRELGRTLEELKLGQQEIAEKNRELKYLATRDPLTSCLNRRAFFEGLRVLIDEEQQQGNTLSCIMMDIDHFKSVNDNYGHAIGDKVIQMVAQALKETSRANDLVGRYGGEEFCVVLPHTRVEEASQVAQRMRLLIEGTAISLPDGEFHITASFGIARWTNAAENAEAFVSQADEALYMAKENGRNRVEIWMEDGDAPAIGQNPEPAEQGELNSPEPSSTVQTLTVPDPELEEQTPILTGHNNTETENIYSIIPGKPTSMASTNTSEPATHPAPSLEPDVFGFPSREVMLDRITQAIFRAKRNQRKFALLVLDLEKARQISNTIGHAASERFISEMQKKISQEFRSTDTISILDLGEFSFSLSQLSSYEFAIMIDDFAENEFVVSILNRIFKILESAIVVEANELYLDGCIGVSIYPNDGQEPEELLRNSSTAMHEARLMMGRNKFRFYSRDINIKVNEQLKTENDLHKAIERDEFLVFYQPKIDINTATICGMEALVRWQHPELGMVPPDNFIPLAERNGLIEAITTRVISIVCGHLQAWQEAGLSLTPIAINLSPVQFRNPLLARQIINQVKELEIAPKFIELEMTENVAVENLDATVKLLQEFNDAGFSVSLDDFGTGYCSYSYLKCFSVDKIKIDRSIISGFADNTFDAAIVNSIITLADNLGLKVVAEGVETEDQLRFLRDLHCHQVQGYLFSKPVPYEEALKFISEPMLIHNKAEALLGNSTNSPVSVGFPLKAELTGILNKVH